MADKSFRLRHLMLLVSSGYIPTGIVFGSLAFILGLKIEYTLGLSAFVYSGAVQSTVLGIWVSGINIPSLILIAFLLNLRYSFYGIHMERKLNKITTIAILVIAPFLTDEVYVWS
jgi:Predicted branched-chain amino acid permease (azaleucine resistance)